VFHAISTQLDRYINVYKKKKSKLAVIILNHRRSQIGFDSFESAKRPFCGSCGYRHSQKNRYSSVDVRIQLGFSMLECVNKCARLLSNNVHPEIPLNFDQAINTFAADGNRRIQLIFPY
jgi:hypothetical protein